jgi:hypothetical protein
MVTTFRRLFWLALLGGAGFAGWALWSSSRPDSAAAAPTRAPTRGAAEPTATPRRASGVAPITTTTDPKPATPAAPQAFAASATAAVWVEPVDGACPDGFPIKANDNSGIYHVPGGRFYERTRPERCYPTAEAAEADGYRRSKS